MAQLIQPFDASQINPEQGSGQLPIGKHPVVVQSSEVKPNKNNDGGYLQLDLLITDGPQKGASGAYRLNLYHSNPTTVQIAQKQLSSVCHVTGVFMLQDSTQLHNIPFIIEVGPQKDAQYTEVKKVFDAQGNEPGKQNSAPQAQQQQQQPAPQQPNPVGGFGSNAPAPQGAQWGGQGQQAPAQQPQQNAPAWGQQPAPQQQQAPAAGWQQQQPAAQAPWGAPR